MNSNSLYLDTINRQQLDFDFEKLCSVSLQNINVYGCLCCGKYFQGRSKQSPAYYHSMNEDHHCFINLNSLQVYVLPDGYQVTDNSLNDIKQVIKPIFTKEQVFKLDLKISESKDLFGKQYYPGYVGMNNIKHNDYINSVVQALARVKPLRDHFLLNDVTNASELVSRFGLLMRKIWNPKAFKGHVSPHELVQEISRVSKKEFSMEKQSDPIKFLSWFLTNLHRGLGGGKKPGSSLIHQIFQGKLLVESQSVISIGRTNDRSSRIAETGFSGVTLPFLFLTLEPAPAPLFAEDEKNSIPQVPITDLLARFDGKSCIETDGILKRYSIQKLPKYLILCIKRFSNNNFVVEKNPTIVNYPLKNLDMADYLSPDNTDISTKYDLIANIIYEGGQKLEEGHFKVDVLNPPLDSWFQIQDLFVDKIMAQMIMLSESYIQIWKQQ